MKKQTTNRIMLAAPGSGSGKTTVTCALLKVLKDRGMDVAGFKCGPDYIDPLFHKKILGVESRNLDTFFAGEEGVRKILSACSAGVAVIEGVMGLYDGLSVSETKGSAYEIADLTDTPIILVVDASGIGRTVISLIKGMLLDDTKKLIRGVILNRITESFYEKL
ncbi:MAG: cobyrinic acid a,c-diamide synthase, partial [Lachnospiraceae bacterium]|nr:cobyrinic acid a,c-diamide synthase [Lachnospiraceae bacterium]